MKQNDHEKLKSLIKDIQFAMMTTVDSKGKLHSRPMATMGFEDVSTFEGVLWFFTRKETLKVQEIESEKEINLSYADPSRQRYISITGMATIETDRDKMKQLWRPHLKAWFPDGLDDKELALIKVNAESAEYWDSPGSAVVRIVGLAKSLVTGKPYDNNNGSHHVGRSH